MPLQIINTIGFLFAEYVKSVSPLFSVLIDLKSLDVINSYQFVKVKTMTADLKLRLLVLMLIDLHAKMETKDK